MAPTETNRICIPLRGEGLL